MTTVSEFEEVALDPGLVRAQLKRVLGSPDFARADRATEFLRFIVEETLEGRADRIKAFTIAIEVFGRDETFNPQTDTIVRVEAGALRRRLERYYLTRGQDDPVVIEIPKGGYVPTFQIHGCTENQKARTSFVSPGSESASLAANAVRRRVLWGSFFTLALAAIFVAIWVVKGLTTRDETSGELGTTSISRAKTAGSTPFLAVLPLETLTNGSVENQLATGLVESVIMKFTNLTGLSVMAHSSVLWPDVQVLTLTELHRDFGVTHVLRGSLTVEDQNLRINSQLINATTGVTLWANLYEKELEQAMNWSQEIVDQVASQLGIQLGPEELRRLQDRYAGDPEIFEIFSDAMLLLYPPTDREQLLESRKLFEKSVTLDPSFAPGYAGRSLNYSLWVGFDHSKEPQHDLQVAIELARIAIDMDAGLGMGQSALGVAYFWSGKPTEGLEHALRSIDLDPGDSTSRAWLGNILNLSGRPDEAVEQITEAIRLNPLQVTAPFLNLLGMAYFNAGRFESAVEAFTRNRNRGGPTGPHMDAFLASAYVETGRQDEARAILSGMAQPSADFSLSKFLTKWIPSEDLRLRTFKNLRQLGLTVE